MDLVKLLVTKLPHEDAYNMKDVESLCFLVMSLFFHNNNTFKNAHRKIDYELSNFV